MVEVLRVIDTLVNVLLQVAIVEGLLQAVVASDDGVVWVVHLPVQAAFNGCPH